MICYWQFQLSDLGSPALTVSAAAHPHRQNLQQHTLRHQRQAASGTVLSAAQAVERSRDWRLDSSGWWARCASIRPVNRTAAS